MKSMLISFLFSSSILSFVLADDNEKHTYKFENDEDLTNLFKFINTSNRKYIYNKAGEITFGLGKFQPSNEIGIYYDADSYRCIETNYNEPGLFFEIVFCLPPKADCEKGMTICYKPQMLIENLKDNFKEHALTNYRIENIDCKKDEHGIKILITNKQKVVIRVSFDEHNYIFDLPKTHNSTNGNRCFKIRFGDENSIGAKITNLMNKKLVFTGEPPLNLDDNFWYSNKKNNNFWLLTLDFIPMRNFYYNTNKYFEYSTNFRYKSEKNCLLVANIRGFGEECNDDDCLLGCITTKKYHHSLYGAIGNQMNTDFIYTYTFSEVLEFQSSIGAERKEQTSDHKSYKVAPKIGFEKFVKVELGFEHTWGHIEEKMQIKRNSRNQIVRYLETETQTIYVPKNNICSIKSIDLRCYGWKFLNLTSITHECQCFPGAKEREYLNGTFRCIFDENIQSQNNIISDNDNNINIP